MVADRRKQSLKASQQRTRDFVDGLIQYVSSHNENYKYFITGSKLNANIIMEQVIPAALCLNLFLNVANCSTAMILGRNAFN